MTSNVRSYDVTYIVYDCKNENYWLLLITRYLEYKDTLNIHIHSKYTSNIYILYIHWVI